MRKELILIVTPDPDRAGEVAGAFGDQYRSATIPSLDLLHSVPEKPCALVLDTDVAGGGLADVPLNILKRSGVPIVLLTNPQNGKGIGELMDQVGASGCIVRTGAYLEVLNYTVKRAVAEARDKEMMRQALFTLKERNTDLERRLKESGRREDVPEGDSLQASPGDILQEIVFVFKRGEIDLPTHPKMSHKFRELIEKGAGLQEIANLLKQDAALSSKLISISNSPYYRGFTMHKTLEQAIGRLGLNTTKRYADVILHRALFATKNRSILGILEMLWEHSLACAYASQGISESLNLVLSEDPFTLGLLHDIGKLVLLQTIGELQRQKKLGENVDRGEILSTLTLYHGKFGASLLKLWKFSIEYILVASHHDSLEKADPITKALLIVHAANLLARSMGYDLGEDQETDVFGADSVRLLGLEPDAIPEIVDRVKREMEQVREYFS
ncbi:MAG: HDOD domain-containing protein [Deltaproteobacteria bacterium]|nr:HDOD domain-containing protein [Deltaproteobacteria bacterium]